MSWPHDKARISGIRPIRVVFVVCNIFIWMCRAIRENGDGSFFAVAGGDGAATKAILIESACVELDGINVKAHALNW